MNEYENTPVMANIPQYELKLMFRPDDLYEMDLNKRRVIEELFGIKLPKDDNSNSDCE